MNILTEIIKGALIGISNIIPGVSGGTMAVSLGIYDKLIFALTDLFKHFKKSINTLWPVFVGIVIGIIGFTYVIEFLLRCYTLPTCLAFIGLIFGGIPMLWRNYKENTKKSNVSVNLIIFLVFFSISAFLPMLNNDQAVLGALQIKASELIILFFLGVIASATMIIPGVSGSMILMIFGYYYAIINTLKGMFNALKDFEMGIVIQMAIPLVFFGIGILVGIFLFAKCIRFLLEKHAGKTYSGILGLVVASPIAMLYNTDAIEIFSSQGSPIQLAAGVALMVICFIVINYSSKKSC